MTLGLAKGQVQVVPYDPAWAEDFATERQEVLRILAELRPAPTIEHIGSTAIPGLAAKPIIDIAIGFPARAQVSKGLRLLKAAGRDYVKAANQPGMLFMALGDPRRFHYHLVALGTPAWGKLITFRNYLRRHPVVAAEYAVMKQTLAQKFPDSRFDYMRFKRPLLRAILQRSYADARRRRFAVAVRQALAVAEFESGG